MCDSHRYTLLADESYIGEPFYFPEFPSLTVQLVDVKNRLCPSRYNKEVQCFWEGDLEVTLRVNGQLVTINDHDAQRNRESVVDKHRFKGESVFIDRDQGDRTYLVFTICHIIPPLIYQLNQPFTIVLEEQAGTGFSWQLILSPEISLIKEEITSKDRSVGGGTNHIFHLKGIARGKTTVTALYKRPWEKNEFTKKVYEIEII